MKYIGFVVDGLVPTLKSCIKHHTPLAYFKGWASSTPLASMRYGWISDCVNNEQIEFYYELYKPLRRYHAVIFLKSMNDESYWLMRKLQSIGVKTIFDANVDYISEAVGTFYYDGMAPTSKQQEEALRMATECDAVIGDSRHLTSIVNKYNSVAETIEDNVLDELVMTEFKLSPCTSGRLNLLWSGQAAKLFELLVIAPLLYRWKDKIHLKLVTNSLTVIDMWYPEYKTAFEKLLSCLSYEIIPFQSIPALMSVYDTGGVCISPRFLDNSYNLGHTEWKISLAMARGRVALCSPQESYVEMARRSGYKGIRICHTAEDWDHALEEVFMSTFPWEKEEQAAVNVVQRYYTTSKISLKHQNFIGQVLNGY